MDGDRKKSWSPTGVTSGRKVGDLAAVFHGGKCLGRGVGVAMDRAIPQLFVCTQHFTSRDGGMGTWLEQIARVSSRSGCSTQVFHFTATPAPTAEAADCPFRYCFIPIPRPKSDSSTFQCFQAMGRAIWRLRPSLAQSNLLLEAFGESPDLKFWTFLLAGHQARPYGLIIGSRTFDDHAPNNWRKRLRNHWYRRWMTGARGILADGEDIREELARNGVNPERVRVLYASIDTTRYHPEVSTEPFWQLLREQGVERRQGPLLVYCGRLLFMNRPRDFLEILARIPEAWGVVVGEGPDRQALEEQARKLQGRAVFVGHQPEKILASAFRAADVCLFPLGAAIAGISLVVPKAMACGAAVITNEVADLRKLVLPEQNGLLCTEGDIDSWVKATLRLLEEGELRRRLGGSALQTIRDYWTEAAREQEYREWFASLLAI